MGLAADGLVAAGLMVAEATIALAGLGAVGGPRGFGDTGGGTRFGSGQTENNVSLFLYNCTNNVQGQIFIHQKTPINNFFFLKKELFSFL